MATESKLHPRHMARCILPALRAEPTVEQLWVGQHRDTARFWVITRPIDADTELRLYGVLATLYDRFPEAYIDVAVLNPVWFVDGDALSEVPSYAEVVPSRPT